MLFFFAIIGLAGGLPGIFINIPAALLVLAPLVFFLFVTKSGKIISKYITTSFKKNNTYTKTELEQLSFAIKNTIKFILAAGGFCCIACMVISLGYIGSPEQLGPNLANSLLSFTYAIAIGFFVFFPVQAWAENKINTIKNDI